MPSPKLTAFVDNWCDILKVPERAVRDLLVFKSNSEVPMLNYDKTLENILLYTKKNDISCKDGYIMINMELSPQALEEWKQIIDRYPILTGNDLP